jgi:SAM-dependent methyltransferase
MRLAPGHVLQHMYLTRRLRPYRGGRFIEVGSGSGLLSSVLLGMGMTGEGVDRNPDACAENGALNAAAIASSRYRIHQGDFFSIPLDAADVVISSMVLEHLEPPQVDAYFVRARSLLRPGGRVVTLVPGSPAHWGIEDDIAGHKKRYTRACFEELAQRHGLELVHEAGLTFPLSNWLLPLSNFLVRRRESSKLALSADDRTVASGKRDVPWKTTFPSAVGLAVNELTLSPFFVAQKLFRNHPHAMVRYAELALP